MNGPARLGAGARARVGEFLHVLSVVGTVLGGAFSLHGWPRTTRNVLARQVLFTGFDAVRFVAMLALLMGVSVVLQTQVGLTSLGQSGMIGPILVAVIIRELGPLLVNFLVIGRSGTAIASELATMRATGELRVLEAQGLDPLAYLMVPRGVGVALSVFCLTIIFIGAAFFSGYVSGRLLGANVGPASVFLQTVFGAIRPADVLNVLAKTLIPGFLTGIICSLEGLSVRGALTEIPQAATRGVIRSVYALFIVSVLVSLLTYL